MLHTKLQEKRVPNVQNGRKTHKVQMFLSKKGTKFTKTNKVNKTVKMPRSK